jgi:hypothetical protein
MGIGKGMVEVYHPFRVSSVVAGKRGETELEGGVAVATVL